MRREYPTIVRALCTLLIVMVCTVLAGCASSNVNPSSPHGDKGYVDFYVVNDTQLSWQIQQVKEDGKTKKVFSEFKPIEGNILRLALEPGHYKFNVILINRTIIGPGVVDVEIKQGMVSPVRVTLMDAGTGQVIDREMRLRSTAYGRYGRGTTVESHTTVLFRVGTEAENPQAYQTKPQMNYAAQSDEPSSDR